ncbi:hypothetical protein, partial [Nonomuraea aridisoli]|uniref:hypothetical protein n=1 Tax=Nonomuraea aridisoli TaxID=2070368 RepID=UPI001C64F6BE
MSSFTGRSEPPPTRPATGAPGPDGVGPGALGATAPRPEAGVLGAAAPRREAVEPGVSGVAAFR